jgi:succinyl-CoA synthetase alpha subunit
VQGITGREGRLRANLMIAAGTKLVAGVTPGRGGEKFGDHIPVYDTVAAAKRAHPGITGSMVCVPSVAAKDATLEALAAGVTLIHLMPERLPHQVIAWARKTGAVVIGPNSPGILSPGKASIGGLGGRPDMMRIAFLPGSIGIISRSGGNTMTLAYYLMKSGLGVSTAIGVGGDAFIGTSWRTLLELFEQDAGTDAVVAYGEIGGNNEEEAAEAMGAGLFTKPLIALIGGRTAREGMRFGHAGAIISGSSGSPLGKIAALRAAGAIVIDHLDELGPATVAALAARKRH